MKKTILLLFISVIARSQSLQILTVTPSALCAGDTMTVKYQFAPGNNLQISMSAPNHGQVWQYNQAYLSSMPSTTTGTVTTYSIKLKVPPSAGTGFGYVFNPQEQNKHTLDMWCGVETGITELNRDEIKPTYYDLMGNRIEKRMNEYIIEQRAIYVNNQLTYTREVILMRE
jgi:hypothetical protein